MIKDFLWVGMGAALGAMGRLGINLLFKDSIIPYNTLFVNIIGSFALGILFAYSLRAGGLSTATKLFIGTGICGGFTTFSAFSLENMGLLQAGKVSSAFIYISISVFLGIGASFLGYKLFQQ